MAILYIIEYVPHYYLSVFHHEQNKDKHHLHIIFAHLIILDI